MTHTVTSFDISDLNFLVALLAEPRFVNAVQPGHVNLQVLDALAAKLAELLARLDVLRLGVDKVPEKKTDLFFRYFIRIIFLTCALSCL